MGKPITWAEKLYKGAWLMDLGYRDYIAARLLLNNHLVVQGLTLASTSVEKYLKAIIVFNLKEEERYNYHLDKFVELKKLLQKVNKDVTEGFDPYFKEILETAFKIRYYDRIKKPISFGFYINQFIGELDYTINLLENFIARTENGGMSVSAYNRAINYKDPHLYENNFVLNKENKKDYMEKPDIGFSIYIRIESEVQEEEVVKGGSTKNIYEGKISKFTEFGENPFGFYRGIIG